MKNCCYGCFSLVLKFLQHLPQPSPKKALLVNMQHI
jgi:hypothetical protein